MKSHLLPLLAVTLHGIVVESLIIPAGRQHRYVTRLFAEADEDTTQKRRPWEIGRFALQSSKFVTLPFSRIDKKVVRPNDVLWEYDDRNFEFGPLDDVVMGGASSSTFDNVSGRWRGTVTDANNGGFIGIRSHPAFQYDMSACKGVEIKVRGGEGKRFKFVLRDSTDFNGITWSTSCTIGNQLNPLLKLFGDEKDDTAVIQIPFDEQIPALFARTVPDQVFKKNYVTAIQVAYSKFEYDGEINSLFEQGDVDLQILSIRAF
mmetsp:Transcript_10867/g.16712  ORF Transcript_10867/g.16712 Transcript_10867/m.16712 type:complete len:261 (+) Transcript_10867:123-905(+)